jgi:predicted AAA+ superfamily ATPase
MEYQRNSTESIQNGLENSPVIFINGARQVGKSTLAKLLVKEKLLVDYFTMDDLLTLAAAISAPISFLEDIPQKVVLDEIQRAPELFFAIKKIIDENRKPGSYLLTGSANVLTMPKIAESLAGRMEIHTLWPLSQGEILGRKEAFIDQCFSNKKTKLPPASNIKWSDLIEKIIAGGYPEALERPKGKRRNIWFSSYIDAILQRDIRELTHIEGLKELPNLLSLLASRVCGLLNISDISRTSKISHTTLRRYLALLEMVFLTVELPAWFKNLTKRLAKSPKMYLNDTGILSYLLGIDAEHISRDRNLAGCLVENFVLMELVKQKTWNETECRLYHFRTQMGQEVDIVLEARDGSMVGIEVKSRSEVYSNDFNGLKVLQELAGNNFVRGIILYTGDRTVAFGDNLFAVPISALWNW